MECVALIGKCRACQMKTQQESQVFIFATTNLAYIFQEATSLPIHENDGFPGVLCLHCYNRLLEAYNFRKMCAAAAMEFHQVLSDAAEAAEFLPEEKYRPPETVLETKVDPDDVAMDFNFPVERKFEPEPSGSVDPLTTATVGIEREQPRPKGRPRKKHSSSDEDESYHPHIRVKQEDKPPKKKKIKSLKTCLKNFVCCLCNRRFLNKLNIEAHMQKFHLGMKNGCICPVCNRGLVHSRSLSKHMARRHGVKDKFSCEIYSCFAQFKTEEGYKTHMRTVHDPNKPPKPPKTSSKPLNYSCTECGQSFASQPGLKKHRNTHKLRDPHKVREPSPSDEVKKNPKRWWNSNLRGVKPTIICDLCGKKFYKKMGLEGHMRTVHQGLKNKCVCPVCGKEIARLDYLKWHMARMHGVKDKFSCEVPGCYKQYENEQSLIYHTSKTHNPDRPRPESKRHICETCGKEYTTTAGLKKHSYSHTGVESRPFACDVCPKRFVTKNKMNIHKMRHEGVKKHVCKICGLAKVTTRELKIHMNTHTRETLHECPFCPLKSVSQSNMKNHIKIVHQGVKAYPCPHCDLSFGRPDTLKHHVRTHTGEKPHACDICGKRFIQPTAMQTHMKTHK